MTQRRPLGGWIKTLYGVGAFAFGVKDNGFSFFLLLYYNQVLGLPEAWVGLGIMVALMVDALVDPIIGHASDHWRSSWGRRHPFMYVSAVPVAVGYFLLWNPPAGLSTRALFAYFVTVAILVRASIALYEIPSASLVPELTEHYDERTSILSYRFFFGWWGGLGMMVLAYAAFLQPDVGHPVGVLNPLGYRRYGAAAALVMLTAILVSSVATHPFIAALKPPPARRRRGLRGIFAELVETLSNRSFVALFLAGVFGAMAAGLTAALTIYLYTYFWELSSNQITLLVLAYFVSAMLAFALTPLVSRRLGKKPAAIAVLLIALAIGPTSIVLRLLGAFPANRSPALLPTLLVFNTVALSLFIMSNILTASMVADIVEDSELATGRRSEGVFVAAHSFVLKAVSGIGIFVSSLVLRLIGFPASARPGEVDPMVVRELGLVYAPVLVALYLIALGFLSTYRIDRVTHEANLRRIAGIGEG